MSAGELFTQSIITLVRRYCISLTYTYFLILSVIYCSGVAETADCRVAQAEGVAAQQMEKAEQAKIFDKSTNKQTRNKQTNKRS